MICMFFGRFMSFKLRNNSFWLGMLVMVNQLFKKKWIRLIVEKKYFIVNQISFGKIENEIMVLKFEDIFLLIIYKCMKEIRVSFFVFVN